MVGQGVVLALYDPSRYLGLRSLSLSFRPMATMKPLLAKKDPPPSLVEDGDWRLRLEKDDKDLATPFPESSVVGVSLRVRQ